MKGAERYGIGVWVVKWWVRYQIRKQFHAVMLEDKSGVEWKTSRESVILCLNHTNWWDGFIALFLSEQHLGYPLWLMQEEEHLERYGFFRKLGVFGVERRNGSDALGGIRKTLRILQRERQAICIFPQGKLCHPDEKISCMRGVPWLQGKSGVRAIPVWLQMEWFVESRPTILIRLGKPLEPGANAEDLSAAMEGLRLKAPDLSVIENMFPLQKPGRSVNKYVDWFYYRVLKREKERPIGRWNL